MSKAKHTIKAAKERRNRDSEVAGTQNAKERQAMVSQNLDERGQKEGRWYGT
ncbi:hypothetical protein [Streptomyces sp. NRRL F-4489]|uniref:hypothetical protein n=1 Tax=Streptomyces sp. NRRL F-4489 TaxID=1609095 RepID=UPI000AEBA8C9|nr:hypothetical protein [Streptomyces sp. NRRL F-4489]